jgi:hypothetical protein
MQTGKQQGIWSHFLTVWTHWSHLLFQSFHPNICANRVISHKTWQALLLDVPDQHFDWKAGHLEWESCDVYKAAYLKEST